MVIGKGSFLEWTGKNFFACVLLTHVASTWLTSLDTLKSGFVKAVILIVIYDAWVPGHAMCFRLFTWTSIHNIQKRIRNSQKFGKKLQDDRRFNGQDREKPSW